MVPYIVCDNDFVCAFFKHPGFVDLVIIRSHIVCLESDCKRLAVTGGEKLCFCKTSKADCALFNAALGIGCAVIKLNNFLACRIARVCDVNLYGYAFSVEFY